jgi:hypothetical protein
MAQRLFGKYGYRSPLDETVHTRIVPDTPPPDHLPPHSDFPLPHSWGDAWPIILWGMLALALVFVFAESLGEIIVNPALRAGCAAVSLIGVTAMLIYRQALLAKFRDPKPSWIVGAICTLIWVLAASPFFEQKQWPFSAWFDQGSEAQKATLIEWLQKAQSETLQARQERESFKQQLERGAPDAIPPDVTQLIKSLRSQLDASEKKRAETERALQSELHPTATIPTWLTLTFDYQGTPSESGSANVHWWWWNPADPASGGAGPLLTWPSTGSSVGSTTTVLFLSFDRPVRSDGLALKSSTALPRWEVAKRVEDRVVVVWIHGQILSGTLEIEVAK